MTNPILSARKPTRFLPIGSRGNFLRRLGIFAIAIAAISIICLVAVPGRAGSALALVAILTAMVLGSALFRPDRGQPAVLDVAFLAGVVMWIGFGLRTILVLSGSLDPRGFLSWVPGYGQFGDADLMALSLAVISWGTMLLAYRTGIGERLARRIPDLDLGPRDSNPLLLVTLLLGVVGWGSRIVLFLRYPAPFEHVTAASLTSVDTALTWLTVLTSVAMALALYQRLFRGAGMAILALAVGLVIGEVVAGLVTGSRTVVISTLLTVVALAVTSGAFRLKPVHLLAVPVVLGVLGATQIYRSVPAPPISQAADVVGRAERTMAAIVDAGPLGTLQAGVVNVVDRYHGLDSVRQVLIIGPLLDPSLGLRYALAIPSAIVPRFLWAGEPRNDLPREFGLRYLFTRPESNVPIAPTWIGDLALSIPLALIPLALLPIGVALRLVNEGGRLSRTRTGLTAVAWALLLPIVIPADSWIDVQIYLVTRLTLVLIGVAAFVLIVRRLGVVAAGATRRATETP